MVKSVCPGSGSPHLLAAGILRILWISVTDDTFSGQYTPSNKSLAALDTISLRTTLRLTSESYTDAYGA